MRDYLKTKLNNGLQLIMASMKGVESVTVLVGVGSGSRDETDVKAGLSHFLEHMASKGTKKRPTPFEIASVIDSVGGEQNAGTSKDFTEYWVKVAAKHLELAFDFQADNLKNSLFDPVEIERERQVIIEEINMYEDLPMRRVMENFESLIYSKTSLGRDIAGSKETVSQITQKDFFNHLARFYQPQNLAVVVAGNFEPDKVKKLAFKYFGDLKNQGEIRKKKFRFSQKQPRAAIGYKKTDQAHFCLGGYGVEYLNPDRFTVSVIASVLGFSRTSRIYREIREKRGLAYYVQTIPEYYSDTGSIFTRAGVALKKLPEAIKIILAEYGRISREKVRPEELNRAKEYLKGRFILELEDSLSVASRYGVQAVIESKLRSADEVLDEINKVTAEDVLRVSRRLLVPRKMNLAVIGPYKDKTKFLKLLK